MGNLRRRGGKFNEDELAEIRKNLEAACDRGEFTTPVVTTLDRLMGYIRGWHWELPERRNETLSVISRVLRVDPLDPFDFTRAEREGRDQAWQASQALMKYVPGFEDAYLLDTNMQIGLRSSRRLHGIETVTDEDAWDFHKYKDSIARSSWNIDIWPADSYTKPAVPRGEAHYVKKEEALKQGEYFDIRYGCIVAKGVDNLLMGGRCISAGHKAEASLRIQQTCMCTGEAAGIAAALSLDQGKSPARIDAMDVVKKVDAYRKRFDPVYP
jgi:hypothetical protein